MTAAASRHTAPCRGRWQDRLLQRGDIDTPKTWTCGCVVAAAMDGRGSECAHGCAPERSRHTRTSTAPSEADHHPDLGRPRLPPRPRSKKNPAVRRGSPDTTVWRDQSSGTMLEACAPLGPWVTS